MSTMSRDMSRDRGYHPHRMCNGLSVVRAAHVQSSGAVTGAQRQDAMTQWRNGAMAQWRMDLPKSCQVGQPRASWPQTDPHTRPCMHRRTRVRESCALGRSAQRLPSACAFHPPSPHAQHMHTHIARHGMSAAVCATLHATLTLFNTLFLCHILCQARAFSFTHTPARFHTHTPGHSVGRFVGHRVGVVRSLTPYPLSTTPYPLSTLTPYPRTCILRRCTQRGVAQRDNPLSSPSHTASPRLTLTVWLAQSRCCTDSENVCLCIKRERERERPLVPLAPIHTPVQAQFVHC